MVRDAILRPKWHRRGARRCAVLGALVAAAALGPAASPAATGWGTVSSPGADGLATPSLALAGTQVLGTWPINGGLNQWSAEASAFTPLTDGTALAASDKRIPLVSGWAGMGPVVLAGSTSPGGYQAMITGGAPTPGPLDGTDFTQRNADGSWGPLVNTGLTECATCSLGRHGNRRPGRPDADVRQQLRRRSRRVPRRDRARGHARHQSLGRVRREWRRPGQLPDARP